MRSGGFDYAEQTQLSQDDWRRCARDTSSGTSRGRRGELDGRTGAADSETEHPVRAHG